VGLLVLPAGATLDAVGVAAAVGAAAVMAVGIVLSKRWPSPAPLLATTGWQLVAGGLLAAPVALAVEGPPPATLTAGNLAGYAYLAIVGAALAYALWYRGIRALSPASVTFLALLSPVVATALGWLALGQRLSLPQALGVLIVIGSVSAAQLRRGPGIALDAVSGATELVNPRARRPALPAPTNPEASTWAPPPQR
jgi:probable blue pigment (indigoidine) exporter